MREFPEKYILYVGNFFPHKNLKRLIIAFNGIIAEDKFSHYVLVMVGGKKYRKKRNIIITGHLEDNKLDNFYRAADLYVFPSLFEGFGFTPLEAMKRGVPVASSDISCLKEILGSAAIYFDPLDINDIKEKIKKTLCDRELRKELIKRGFELVKNYNWQKTAQETLCLYNQI